MNCPKCHKEDISVIDSRDVDNDSIRRRRECSSCGYRFTTYERIEPVRFTVKKKSGGVEPYDRNKLIKGMMLATEKRDISKEQLERIADNIEQKLIQTNNSVIRSKKIGNLVIGELRGLDEVAYIRFSSVYKDFRSRRSFEKELEKLNNK